MMVPRLLVGIGIDADQIKFAVMYATLGTQGVGKLPDRCRGPAQEEGFKTVLMIKVSMHAGHRQVMMIVLHGNDALAQLTLVVVVHIGKASHAILRFVAALASALQLGAKQIAHRLGTLRVAPLRDPAIEVTGKPIVQ